VPSAAGRHRLHSGSSSAHCVTCGDVATAKRVVALRGSTATVEGEGECEGEHVAVDLVEPVQVGDVLLCHAGVALEKVDAA
jgi:hydrogenase maturation factor